MNSKKIRRRACYRKVIHGRTYHLCNYHMDSLDWDECSDGSEGCDVERARNAQKCKECGKKVVFERGLT